MHIPEGALSPQTYGAAYAVMAPAWLLAGRRVKRGLRARRVPLLAMGAAFSFLLMMFNVPALGGTTGHATGAGLLAILLGPAAATLALSVVLAVQAFLFQDGGLTTLAANCLNIALLGSFAGYGAFRLVGGARRRVLAAGVAGYISLNAAALGTALLLGLQPMLAHGADGRPLFFPIGLELTLVGIMAPHLLVFGFVEAVVTAGAYAYLARTEPSLVGAESKGVTP